MTSSVILLMAIHCHQPVGNFGCVFEQAYAKAYEPFLGVLERHPSVRLALHYSGSLLDWLHRHRPQFLRRVRRLVARGQVELLTSGYFEPILPLIPESDRQGQLAMMRRAIRRRFGADAVGLWLTERVWEPELPETLVRAGVRYTMVDTNQFLPSKPWLPGALQLQDEAFWDVLGSYTTEYAGSAVRLFPSSKRLRYSMPFQPVERTLEFFRRLPREGAVAITFADDGEKFGLWPKTYDWVYGEGWLERFFTALEQESSWLKTSTFRGYTGQVLPDGHVYLPCGSYEEMLEWSGGHFRNFFTKYPEANAMQQAMLRVSETIARLRVQGSGLGAKKKTPRAHSPEPTARHRKMILQRAERELYAGQCNCAYWHGVFGGLYLSHLRRAVYTHLISAEQILNPLIGRRVAITPGDHDGDGAEEIRLTTPRLGLVIDPAEGGTVTSWHLYQSKTNLLDTLSRRPEPYHQQLRAMKASAVAVAAGEVPTSIHDALGTKESHLEHHLTYDDHRRSAFLDYAFQSLPSLEEARRSSWGERRLWSPGPWVWDRQAARRRAGDPLSVSLTRSISGGLLRKTVRVLPDRPVVECHYALEDVRVPVMALEFNVCLRDEGRMQGAQEQRAVRTLTVEEGWSGIRLQLTIDPPAMVYTFPVETVSGSEGGMERTFQGLCLVCLWEPPASSFRSRVQWDCEAPRTPVGRSPERAHGRRPWRESKGGG